MRFYIAPSAKAGHWLVYDTRTGQPITVFGQPIKPVDRKLAQELCDHWNKYEQNMNLAE